jgi:hypothetical protein
MEPDYCEKLYTAFEEGERLQLYKDGQAYEIEDMQEDAHRGWICKIISGYDTFSIEMAGLERDAIKIKTKVIYTITTVRGYLAGGSRAVGYFHSFEDADVALRDNVMDINECGYYPYAVIEPVEEGIYMHPRDEHWYRFNKEKDQYEPCEKPERYKQVVGWSLG